MHRVPFFVFRHLKKTFRALKFFISWARLRSNVVLHWRRTLVLPVFMAAYMLQPQADFNFLFALHRFQCLTGIFKKFFLLVFVPPYRYGFFHNSVYAAHTQ